MREIKKVSTTIVDKKKNAITVTNELYSLSNSKENEHKITVRLSAILIDTLKNIIASNKAGGNFEYTNVSDLLRKALEAYKNGMSLVNLMRMKIITSLF